MILDDIVKAKNLQIELEKETKPIGFYLDNLEYKSLTSRNFKEVLNKEGVSIIGEIKKSSPSKGIIIEKFDLAKIGKIYEKINIEAVSVLTERQFFKGDDDYIKMVKSVNTKPILRKDFIIDEYQVFQSKAIGADAILLIVSILGNKIKEFYKLAKSLGLDCLTEVHSEKEIKIALAAGCDIIGVNNRNLKDFTVSLKTTEKLIKYIPSDITVVSESGIKQAEDIKYLSSIGVNAVLIGETFMKNIEDENFVKNFIAIAKSLDDNIKNRFDKKKINYD